MEMGTKKIKRLYSDCGVTKILTIEASGIAIAMGGSSDGTSSVRKEKTEQRTSAAIHTVPGCLIYTRH